VRNGVIIRAVVELLTELKRWAYTPSLLDLCSHFKAGNFIKIGWVAMILETQNHMPMIYDHC